ncbi:MAG: biotin--[acetyl-CoA-carboxylase] ligase [Alphaproteobacteria bacterium]|nr:biotin--[acetyl-CoA-carboxylase] ligase [Alphaproteobacteria bacterium]
MTVHRMMTPPSRTLARCYDLTVLGEVGSTSDEAKRLAATGAPHGAVVWAKRQTGGRGRYGRQWDSPEGNLHVSLLLRPEANAATATQLSFVAATAVHKTLSAILSDALVQGEVSSKDVNITLKWPNDILLNGKKIGGILLESATHADGKLDWLVLGIGVNIAHFPDDCPFPATSLDAVGVKGISAKIVLSRLLHHFAVDYGIWEHDGFAPARAQWLHHAAYLGKEISSNLENEEISGVFEGLDADGALLLARKDGTTRRITSGEVFGK